MKAEHPPVQTVSATRADWVILILLATSLLTNVVLGLGFLRISASHSPIAAARPAAPSGPTVGDALPPINAQRLGTAREEVLFSSDPRPTLLYVFGPSCSWCARNEKNALAVFSQVKDTHRVIALSLAADVGDSVKRFPVHVTVYVEPAADMYGPYHLGATPATLVVSPAGRVLKSWVGAYAGTIKKEVEAYFGVTLPGLARGVSTQDEQGR